MSVPMLHYREQFDRLQPGLPGAGVPWLTLRRGEAMAAFQSRAFPDTRVEAWKYTDLHRLNRHVFKPATTAGTVHEPLLRPWLFDGTPMHRLVFVDGQLAATLCPSSPVARGITLRSIAQVLEREPQRLEAVLGRTLSADRPGFDSMNSAFLQDGYWLRLESAAVAELPVHLLFVSTGQAGSMMTLRNVIEAAPGSAATVIETRVALRGADCLVNAVTEVVLETGASLQHYQFQQDDEAAIRIAGLYVQQARDSRLATHCVTLGGGLVRNELQVRLDGPGAECALNGLILARDRQHVDNHTRIDHHAPHATSNEWYRAIVQDRARSVFSGRIVVHPQAQQTRAQQSSHNLLLSARAEADARPQFEIRADDVRCTHGCTTGELDADALFYLRTRGLDEETARSLLIHAFARESLERMECTPVRDWLEQRLATRLGSGGMISPQGSH